MMNKLGDCHLVQHSVFMIHHSPKSPPLDTNTPAGPSHARAARSLRGRTRDRSTRRGTRIRIRVRDRSPPPFARPRAALRATGAGGTDTAPAEETLRLPWLILSVRTGRFQPR